MRILGVFIVGALAMWSTAALACSCGQMEPRTLSEFQAAGSKLVLGRVLTRVKTGGVNVRAGYVVYLIEVEDAVNMANSKFIAVRTTPDGASCGVDLPVGTLQVLSIAGETGNYNIGLCGNPFRIRFDDEARSLWTDFKAGGTIPRNP